MQAETKNLDKIIEKYIKSIIEFSAYINRITNHKDLNPKQNALVINNDERANKLYFDIERALEEFKQETFAAITYTCSDHLAPFLKNIWDELSGQKSSKQYVLSNYIHSIIGNWESIQAIIGEDDDLEALQCLIKLPNFDPDTWLRREVAPL